MTILGSGEFTYEVSGKDWGDLPDGWTYREATAVAVDSKDNVYVFNRGTCPMVVFDRNGSLLRAWGEGVFATPHGVTIGPDDAVYCTDNRDHTVRKFTPEGKLLMTLGTPGQPAAPMSGDPFCVPAHLAVDPRNGDLYVADGYSNARVHHFTPDGKLVKSWGESGTDPGQFNIVHNIDIDEDGWVYVADRENHRIQVFDTDGRFQTQWVNLSRAAAIYVDQRGSGLVYVGELLRRHRNQLPGDRPRPPSHHPGPTGRREGEARPAELRGRGGEVLLPPRHLRRLARRHLRCRGVVVRLRAVHGPPARAPLASRSWSRPRGKSQALGVIYYSWQEMKCQHGYRNTTSGHQRPAPRTRRGGV